MDDDVTNYVNFWNNKWKMAKTCVFLKLTLCQLKKDFQYLFSAFETQDNKQIEYI